MGDEYAYLVMGICILVMLGYGHDESAPTPDGVFRTNFVVDVGNWRSVRNQFRGGRGELAECSHSIS